MAIGNMDLYKALKEAGASDESAAEAAKSVAGQLPRFWAVTGTLATLAPLNLGLVGLQFNIVERLGSLDARATALDQRATGIEQHVTGIEQHVTGIEQHVTGIDQRAIGIEQHVTGIEQRLTALEERGAQWHAEIMQQFETLQRERGGGGQP
jgi:hypothetical protein